MNRSEAKSHFVDSLQRMKTLQSDQEWEEFFDHQLDLLTGHPERYGEFAIIHCYNWILTRGVKDNDKFDDVIMLQKTSAIAERIFALSEVKASLTVWFFFHLFILRQSEILKNWWLESYENKAPGMTHEVYLIGVISQRYFDYDSWSSAFDFLEPYLDHKSDFVRSATAAALAHIFKKNLDDRPSLSVLLDNIKTRELERPGLAGPFWHLLNDWFEYEYREKYRSVFDQVEWLLQIMENRRGKEPIFSTFRSVDDLVCKLAQNDISVLRRLLRLGAYLQCYDLAFEQSEFSEEFKELLIDMGNTDDRGMHVVASCLLAFEYNYVHPHCQSLGVVKRFDQDDVSIIVIYGERVPLLSAAIHPQQGKLSDSIAWKWINNLLPPDDRQGDWEPEIEDDTITYGGEDRTVVLYGNVHDKLWDKVVIKEPTRNVVID